MDEYKIILLLHSIHKLENHSITNAKLADTLYPLWAHGAELFSTKPF